MKSLMIFTSTLLTVLSPVVADKADIAEEASQHIDIETNGTVYTDQQFTVSCNHCSVIGDLSFSGGCDDSSSLFPGCIKQWAPDANFSMLPVDFTKYWLGVAFDDFKIHIELDFDLTPSQPSNEIIIHPSGDSGITIPFSTDGQFSTVFTFNPQIHGWVNSTTPAKFSYGFDFTIPAHSAIWIPVLHLEQFQTFGLNQSTLTTTGLTSNNSNLSFDFELSFRPSISAEVNFDSIFTDNITLYGDLPNINLAVSQVQNVIDDCTPAPAGTDSSHVYGNLTHVVPSLTTDFDLSLAKPSMNLLVGPFNESALPTQCLDFEAKSTSLVNAPVVGLKSSGVGRARVTVLPMIFIAFGAMMIV